MIGRLLTVTYDRLRRPYGVDALLQLDFDIDGRAWAVRVVPIEAGDAPPVPLPWLRAAKVVSHLLAVCPAAVLMRRRFARNVGRLVLLIAALEQEEGDAIAGAFKALKRA